MRPYFLAVALSLGSCVASPACQNVEELLGSYRRGDGPSSWSEIRLQPGGVCECSSSSLSAGGLLTQSAACWRFDGSHVTIEVQHEAMFCWSGPRRLAVKHWDGYPYLVPKADIDWFDNHGPMHEDCFYPEGATVFARPAYQGAK